MSLKAVIQRVSSAKVTVGEQTVGEIGRGFLVLLGVSSGDKREQAEYLAKKIAQLRVFADENDKMNRSVSDIEGSVLVVSNFTLCADCRKGRRPSFVEAALPEEADFLYEYFVLLLKEMGIPTAKGVFGEDMAVSLVNDGPVTIVMDTREMLGEGGAK